MPSFIVNVFMTFWTHKHNIIRVFSQFFGLSCSPWPVRRVCNDMGTVCQIAFIHGYPMLVQSFVTTIELTSTCCFIPEQGLNILWNICFTHKLIYTRNIPINTFGNIIFCCSQMYVIMSPIFAFVS